MKMRLNENSPSSCTITYDDEFGERVYRRFYASSEGGYVREGTDSQVCDRLDTRGPTLIWSPRAYPRLADFIRAEYRRMRRHEARRNAD